jgi:thioredoxin reductase (NADPH)
MSDHVSPVIILGAGPVGLFAAFNFGLLGMRSLIIDGLAQVGGQCAALYPEKPIYDIPACPAILAKDLVDRLMEQLRPFQPTFCLGHHAKNLRALDHKKWAVGAACGPDMVSFEGRVVLICTGGGQFTPKKPAVARLEEFENKSVFYHVTRVEDLKDKRVMVAGGGDSAVDWALLLCEKGAQVTLMHRRDQFKAQEASLHQLQQAIQAQKIRFLAPRQLAGLEGANGQLTRVILEDFQGGLEPVDIDVLLPFYGLDTEKSPFADWGLEVQGPRLVIDPTTGQTNLPGIYGAGDCVVYPQKLKLIMTGFSETAQGAHHAKKTCFPDMLYRFQHSTSLGLPT